MLTRDELESLHEAPLPKLTPLKHCKGTCGLGVELDKAAVFFDADASFKDGFKTYCKDCRAKRRGALKLKDHHDKRARVDKVIAKLIQKAQFGGSDVPHIAELFAKVIALMGGANGFAMAFLDTYLKAEPGSATRQRLLNQLGNMGTAVTATGVAEVPNSLLSDEELQKKMLRLAEQAKQLSPEKKPALPPADDGIESTASTEGLDDE